MADMNGVAPVGIVQVGGVLSCLDTGVIDRMDMGCPGPCADICLCWHVERRL